MSDFIQNSAAFGVMLSLAAYGIGVEMKKKLKCPLFNPLLISIAITILVLLLFRIDYNCYYNGAKYISYLLTPATVCLAIPLYEQLEALKHNWKAIVIGISSGVITSMTSILAMVLLFQLNHQEYVTLLPKSITTAIGMDVSAELKGYVSVTVAVIIITGVLGNVFAETLFKRFKITEPVAKGVALGTSAHAIGTAKAMELGDIEGAMSSLSIVVAGMITVILASVYAQFL
ncbi:LrgA-associated membrane protein LrgB [Lachnospiraceae bacterium KM106-2]|nr:LrgA-associated membrane protein LrgB [Lachnospiraceae bacterium KM106-2]